jgi:hypothetical protein
MTQLKPLKIHSIIGTSTVWTDELWDEALTYLLERTGTLQVLAMCQVLHDDELPNSLHKIDPARIPEIPTNAPFRCL